MTYGLEARCGPHTKWAPQLGSISTVPLPTPFPLTSSKSQFCEHITPESQTLMNLRGFQPLWNTCLFPFFFKTMSVSIFLGEHDEKSFSSLSNGCIWQRNACQNSRIPSLPGLIEVQSSVGSLPPGARCSLCCVGLSGCFFLKLDPKTCVCAHLHSECITWYIYFCPLADYILWWSYSWNCNYGTWACQTYWSYFRVKQEISSNKLP